MSYLLEIGYTDVILLAILSYVVYHFFFKKPPTVEVVTEPELPKIEMMDLTVEQMKKYNGVDDPHIFVGVAGRIFDVTRGKDYYGPEGVYSNFAGHDGTRAFATFDMKAVKDDYDDISDLNGSDLSDALEWEERLRMKYPFVGRLLAPGDKPRDYNGEKATIQWGTLGRLDVEENKFVERPVKVAE
ncbi:Membrane-associated progesterone receptor component 1 [Aphelenchoides besseyi]|nr:Membrane-associated progesterone receptor component 1 [Aphelenchoides besseyi]